jgi:hypothetical protein
MCCRNVGGLDGGGSVESDWQIFSKVPSIVARCSEKTRALASEPFFLFLLSFFFFNFQTSSRLAFSVTLSLVAWVSLSLSFSPSLPPLFPSFLPLLSFSLSLPLPPSLLSRSLSLVACVSLSFSLSQSRSGVFSLSLSRSLALSLSCSFALSLSPPQPPSPPSSASLISSALKV